jgi:hypothetical protein
MPDDMTKDCFRALYFYRAYRTRKILYIGKAYRQSIKDRWNCPSKQKIVRRGVTVRPFVTGFHTSRRLTPQLFDDVERLLIFLVQPEKNRHHKESCRLHHKRLDVECLGEWPYPRYRFSYNANLPFSLSFSSK